MPSKSKHTGLGIAVGAGLGTIFGVIAGNMGVWLAIGVAIGVAIGAAWKSKAPECPQCAAIHHSHPDAQKRLS